MNEIKDYLHMHLGCDYLLSGNVMKLNTEALNHAEYHNRYSNIKLILRPLSKMTEEDKRFYGYRNEFDALEFAYLLKQGYDLFRLIEAGFAVDITKFKP